MGEKYHVLLPVLVRVPDEGIVLRKTAMAACDVMRGTNRVNLRTCLLATYQMAVLTKSETGDALGVVKFVAAEDHEKRVRYDDICEGCRLAIMPRDEFERHQSKGKRT